MRKNHSPEEFLAAATAAILAATPEAPTEIEFSRLRAGKNGEPAGSSRRMIVTKANRSKKHDHLLSVWELGSSFPRTIAPGTVREFRRERNWVVR